MLFDKDLTISITPFPLASDTSIHTLFSNIAHLPGAILFDTCQSTKSDGRFNIMVWGPLKTVRASNGKVEVINQQNNAAHTLDVDPFKAVEDQLHSQLSGVVVRKQDISKAKELPFLVGVAGMAGYDTGRYYEQMPCIAENDYQTPEFEVHLYPHSIIHDNHTNETFFCALGEPALPEFISDTSTRDFTLTSKWTSNLTQSAYVNKLDAIHSYLRAGDCYQINMAQRFSATYSGSSWTAYQHLSQANNAPFSAYMQLNNSSILSISPERFIKVKDRNVETKPIKGTRPRFDDPIEDTKSADALLDADKDRAENLMIVDLLRNDMSKHCEPHSVKVPALFALESYEAVHHLVSTVVGKLKPDTSPLSLLASAFPGGSITGAPKVRAMEIIDELEPHRRNIYCGSMFYMGFRNDLDSSICIRTILAEGNTLYCWAGGGIVLDSQPEDEYQETLHKVSKILPELEKLSDQN